MGASEKFVYDSTGNIIQLDDIVLEYSAGDRLQRRGNTQYIYDGNGRLVKKIEDGESQTPKVWEFGWDAEDQLRKVTTPSGEIWEYKYDALGRRIVKQGPKTTTRFVWNGDVIVHQIENKKVLHSSWVFDPYSFVPLCKVQNEQLYSVICDHLGTPRELLDIEGKVVWSVSYKAWGEVDEVQVKEVECPIRFPGQWADEESGLHYNRFRYYEAQSGRFVSADPIGLLGSLNIHAYALNPVNWVDPFGLTNICEKKIKLLQTGDNNTTVEVKTKAEADALLKAAFPDYQKVRGVGHQDPSGIRKKRKMDRFKQGGAYHKDYAINPKTGRVFGHDELSNPHGEHPHINIKRKDGTKVLINIVGGK
jgi:RHS repeat-associated protein